MSDDDLIRRGDALQILGDLSQVDGCFGDAHEAIAALPAVTVGVQPQTADALAALEELANMPLGIPLEDWSRLSARILAALNLKPIDNTNR